MESARALRSAIASADWSQASAIVDESFYRLLFLAPDVVSDVFERAPESFYQEHPRHANSRAIAASFRTGSTVIDQRVASEFAAWVGSQERPARRDLLGVQMARIRQMLARGWYGDADRLVDQVLAVARQAPVRDEGLDDVMPAVLLRCGLAKLLVGDLAGAGTCFAEAARWSAVAKNHPFGPFAAGHLALVHALEEHYAEAATLLEGAPDTRSEPGTIQYYYEPAGLLARLLVTLARLDLSEARRLHSELDGSITGGDLWWVVLHARAQIALIDENPWPGIHELTTRLSQASQQVQPGSTANAVVLSELASLFQATGDLQAAEQTLADDRVCSPAEPGAISRARQALMRGRPADALVELQARPETAAPGTAPRFTPAGAVLYASAERAASGQLSDQVLQHAASAVNHHAAYSALMLASTELRPVLFPLIDVDTGRVPQPWSYRARVQLTRREREVLNALREHPTISAAATALHVSPNTAKTHVRSLYRKLGAHSRDEALWLSHDCPSTTRGRR